MKYHNTSITEYNINSHLLRAIVPARMIAVALGTIRYNTVATVASGHHAARSWACRFAVAKPRFSGSRSQNTSLESLVMILPGVGVAEMTKKERRQLWLVLDRVGCSMQKRTSLLVTKYDQSTLAPYIQCNTISLTVNCLQVAKMILKYWSQQGHKLTTSNHLIKFHRHDN